jgi:diguanylate cyclase (GGDEF)-like protein
MNSRILVVDDEDTIRSVIAQVLEEAGYLVTEAPCAELALQAYREQAYPVVITDIIMSKMSGIELLKELKLLDPEALVVVMTSQASVDSATSALRSGAYDYLTKPFEDLDQITNVVDRALEKKRLTEENHHLLDQLRRNAEELKDLNRQLREMAIRDGLTGLYNHRHFRDQLALEVDRAARLNSVFSLIFCDVDHFKKYNDTHGHLAGDSILKTLSLLLSQEQRSSTFTARYGGEEFVVMLPGVAREGARQLAERMRARVEAHPFPGGEQQPGGRVTLSAGVSCYPQDGADCNQLIEAADRALYAAKAAGRNRVC